MSNKGTVKWFDSQKGYGFIIPDDGSDEIFVHQSSIVMKGFRTLSKGDVVTYEEGTHPCSGKRQAMNVVPFLTIEEVEMALGRENFGLKPFFCPDIYGGSGAILWLIVDSNNLIQTSEQGMTLEEAANFIGLALPVEE